MGYHVINITYILLLNNIILIILYKKVLYDMLKPFEING